MDVAKAYLEHIELILKILALLGAIVYLLFKLANGVYVFGLSVGLKCSREAASEGDDYLLVLATLKAGAVSTVDLHDIQARLSFRVDGEEVSETVTFPRLHRPGSSRSAAGFRVDWHDAEPLAMDVKPLRIRQGEEPSFSALLRVPPGVPCLVELAVIGKRAFIGVLPGKWRANTHVLPIRT